MGRVVPTEPGWWWAEVEGERRAVEVHRDQCVLSGLSCIDEDGDEISVEFWPWGTRGRWLGPLSDDERAERLRNLEAPNAKP